MFVFEFGFFLAIYVACMSCFSVLCVFLLIVFWDGAYSFCVLLSLAVIYFLSLELGVFGFFRAYVVYLGVVSHVVFFQLLGVTVLVIWALLVVLSMIVFGFLSWVLFFSCVWVGFFEGCFFG